MVKVSCHPHTCKQCSTFLKLCCCREQPSATHRKPWTIEEQELFEQGLVSLLKNQNQFFIYSRLKIEKSRAGVDLHGLNRQYLFMTICKLKY